MSWMVKGPTEPWIIWTDLNSINGGSISHFSQEYILIYICPFLSLFSLGIVFIFPSPSVPHNETRPRTMVNCWGLESAVPGDFPDIFFFPDLTSLIVGTEQNGSMPSHFFPSGHTGVPFRNGRLRPLRHREENTFMKIAWGQKELHFNVLLLYGAHRLNKINWTYIPLLVSWSVNMLYFAESIYDNYMFILTFGIRYRSSKVMGHRFKLW